MMIKPGITELDRCVDSRYTLVSMVAKRARMIGTERNKEAEANADASYDTSLEKPVTQAVEEISNGVVGYVRSAAVDRAKAYEEEKIHAITKMQTEAIESASEPAVQAEETNEISEPTAE